MPKPMPAFAALAVLSLASPALAQETPGADVQTEVVSPSAEPATACPPQRKGPGLGALLSAANQAGAGNLLSGRFGAMFGSGKRGVAGAVLGTALSAAAPLDAGEDGAAPLSQPMFGSRKAQVAAVAAGTVIGLAKAEASAHGSACGGR